MQRNILKILLFSAFIVTSGLANPVGLINVGNTCFMNSGLQVLCAMEDIMGIVQRQSRYYEPDTLADSFQLFASAIYQGQNVDTLLQKLAIQTHAALGTELNTQQDVSEFLIKLLDHLTDKDIKKEHKTHLPFYPNTASRLSDLSSLCYMLTLSSLNHGPSNVHEEKLEYHSGLVLNVRPTDATLSAVLDRLFTPELIDYTTNAHQKIKAEKRIYLDETSEYVLLGTAYEAIRENNKHLMQKKPLSFPLSNFNLSKHFLTQRVKPDLYNLKAVVMQSGTADGGHYTTYVCKGNKWYHCNDSSITEISLQAMNYIANQGYDQFQAQPVFFLYEKVPASHNAAHMNSSYNPSPSTNTSLKEPSITKESSSDSSHDIAVTINTIVNVSPHWVKLDLKDKNSSSYALLKIAEPLDTTRLSLTQKLNNHFLHLEVCSQMPWIIDSMRDQMGGNYSLICKRDNEIQTISLKNGKLTFDVYIDEQGTCKLLPE